MSFFDDLEIRSQKARAVDLAKALPRQIAHARENAPYFSGLLAEVDPRAVTNRRALAALPVTRKSDLMALQKKVPPLGGLTAEEPGQLARLFQSPGPIYDAEGYGPDYWRTARAFHAAGVRRGDIIHNTFSYHLTPAGAMIETGAHAMGCSVVPAGVGQTDLQLQAINDIRPTVFAGTPSFLKILLEKAAEIGTNVSSLRVATVAGEALPPSLRQEIEGRGVAVKQWYGSADLGLVAYESVGGEGLIVDEGVVVEIVRPGTGEPLPDGEVGEVVVTTFTREYPLIRFATGDLSAVMAGGSPCGRTNMRLLGWMGRADQATKVKGMFVHPAQVAEVIKLYPQVGRYRLVVTGQTGKDDMTLYCETAHGTEDLAHQIAESFQHICKLKGHVELDDVGSLANDGIVIEDARSYD